MGSIAAIIGSGYKGGKRINSTESDAIKKICEEARKVNANGIINLKITYSEDNRYSKPKPARIITVTGMAVKVPN